MRREAGCEGRKGQGGVIDGGGMVLKIGAAMQVESCFKVSSDMEYVQEVP